MLVENGVDESRIDEVVGKADWDPLVEDPADPTNRRISIILKHLSATGAEGKKIAADEARRRAAAGGAPAGTSGAAPAPDLDDRGSPPAPRTGG